MGLFSSLIIYAPHNATLQKINKAPIDKINFTIYSLGKKGQKEKTFFPCLCIHRNVKIIFKDSFYLLLLKTKAFKSDSKDLEDKASFGGSLNNLFFKSLKLLGQRVLKTFFFLEAVNIHQVPATGPFIITANHFSFMDPPVLQAACPRRIHFLMTEKYYNPIWGHWFFKLMGAIPLRENTSYNIGPVKIGLEILKQGNVIGIFPEGGISKTGIIQEGRPGTLLFAQKSNVPLLPAFISGTYVALPKHAKFFRKSKIKVIFGNPITYDELSGGLKGKKGLEEATQNLMKKISDLSQKDK